MRNHESPSNKPACTCGRRACSYYGNAINASCFAVLLFSDSLTKEFGSFGLLFFIATGPVAAMRKQYTSLLLVCFINVKCWHQTSIFVSLASDCSVYTHSFTRTHKHTHAHTHIHKYTHTHTHRDSDTRAHIHKHTDTRSLTLSVCSS